MRADLDLSRWLDKAREKLLTGRYRCLCGSMENDKMSYNRVSEVICRACDAVIGRITEVQPTHLELMG